MNQEQQQICTKYNSQWAESPTSSVIGISENVQKRVEPIYGLRHPQSKNTNGWYIWSGEYSDAPSFFKPLHVVHLNEICPIVIKYLGLKPGYRFVIDNKGYEDVWFDASLLKLA